MGMMGKVEWKEGERKGKKERKKEKKGGREEKPYSLMIAATWAGNVATTWCPAGICRHDYGWSQDQPVSSGVLMPITYSELLSWGPEEFNKPPPTILDSTLRILWAQQAVVTRQCPLWLPKPWLFSPLGANALKSHGGHCALQQCHPPLPSLLGLSS